MLHLQQHKLLSFYFYLLICIASVLCSKKLYAYDSLIDFENAAQGTKGVSYVWTMNDCFSTGKAMFVWEYGDFNNVQVETVIGSDTKPKSSSTVANVFIVGATRAAVYGALLNTPLTSLIALFALGAEYIHMVETCSNAFIVAPHEYYNVFARQDTCDYKTNPDGKRDYYFVSKDGSTPLTWDDVPFFYHCDPEYDPTIGGKIAPGSENAKYIGRTWGYMGGASQFCTREMEKIIDPNMVGKVVVGSFKGATRFFNGFDSCESFKSDIEIMKAGETKSRNLYIFYPYYRFNSRDGRLQMCVAHPYSLLPVRIGCTSVPPPNEELNLDPFIVAYMENTTCGYFFTGRTDLKSLGEAIQPLDANGNNKQYVKDFLKSDFHMTSTVVNCIKDQLARMIVNPSLSLAGADSKSYFEVVQIRFRQIAFAALILYVSVIAMMLITAPQAPRRGEMLMWLIKLALVVHFIFLQGWYTIENGRKEGLYAGLIYGTDAVANVFLNAQASHNPNDFCYYRFQGDNLIQERQVIPESAGGAVEKTNGYDYLKLSIWDLVDCKVANYLNYGTCKYGISDMIGVWLFGLAFSSGGLGIVLAFVAFLYLFLLLLIIFKFTHTVLLAALVITILIFISPITIVCSLFKPTAAIFQQWMRALIGYFLYPALLFAFLALIMATFDIVYFGRIDYDPAAPPITKQCENINSIYCAIVKATGKTNPCEANVKADLSYTKTVLSFIKVKAVKMEYVQDIFLGLAYSLLFLVIFYFYMGVLDDMISIVMGIHGLGRMAKGSMNVINMAMGAGRGLKEVGSALIGGAKKANKGSGSGKGSGKQDDQKRTDDKKDDSKQTKKRDE